MQPSGVFRLDLLAFLRRTGPSAFSTAWLLAFVASLALAQSPATAPVAPPAATAPSQTASIAAAPASRAASGRAPTAAKANGKPTKPLWRDLKPTEQMALTPLAGTWDTMSVAQKRKWLALSPNYAKLSPDEQAKLHSRMSEWAALSPQQRTQARLNFGATQQLSPDDKKAKWEAYQALPPEEKSKLAARAAKAPPTAPAVKPVPPGKLATINKPKVSDKPRGSQAPAQPVPSTTLPVSAELPASAPAR